MIEYKPILIDPIFYNRITFIYHSIYELLTIWPYYTNSPNFIPIPLCHPVLMHTCAPELGPKKSSFELPHLYMRADKHRLVIWKTIHKREPGVLHICARQTPFSGHISHLSTSINFAQTNWGSQKCPLAAAHAWAGVARQRGRLIYIFFNII